MKTNLSWRTLTSKCCVSQEQHRSLKKAVNSVISYTTLGSSNMANQMKRWKNILFKMHVYMYNRQHFRLFSRGVNGTSEYRICIRMGPSLEASRQASIATHKYTVRSLKTTHCSDAKLPSNLKYKTHQIPKPKCLSLRLAVLFAQSTERRC